MAACSSCMGTTGSAMSTCGSACGTACVAGGSTALAAVLMNPLSCVVGAVIGATCLVATDAACLKCGCCGKDKRDIQTVTVSKKKAPTVTAARRQRALKNPLRRAKRTRAIPVGARPPDTQ